jgi:hypothetical protein
MNRTQSLSTCSMARLQAQFLPTQRSPTGRGPASSSAKRASAVPHCGSSSRTVSRAMASVASLDRSSTSSTRQALQGDWLQSTLLRQAAMLAASL